MRWPVRLQRCNQGCHMADIAVQSTHTNIFRHTQIFLWTRHTHNESCSPELCGGSCLAACNPSLHAIFNKMLELGFKQNGHGRCVHDKGLLQQFISGYYPRINTINHLGFKQRFCEDFTEKAKPFISIPISRPLITYRGLAPVKHSTFNQEQESPSRDLLRECEIFTNLRLKLY